MARPMSEQASMQGGPAGPPETPAKSRTGRDGPAQPLRLVGVAAVCVGVAALAAATFVLSYSGIHAVAIQAGIDHRYAREYPLLIDAMLVITLSAVLALRGAGVPSRILAWLALLAVLTAAAGADALHATGHRLPYNVGAATAAVLPWALVLIAFLLLLALLRHVRLRRQASVARRQQPTGNDLIRVDAGRPAVARPAPLPVRIPQQWNAPSIVPGFTSQLVSSAAAGAAAGAAAAESEPVGAPDGNALGSEQGKDDTHRGLDATADGALEAGVEAGPPDQVSGSPADTSHGPTDGKPGPEDTDSAPGDTDAALSDARAVSGSPATEPGDTDPRDASDDTVAEHSDTDAAPSDTDAEPAETPPGPSESAAASSYADAEPGDTPGDLGESEEAPGDTDDAQPGLSDGLGDRHVLAADAEDIGMASAGDDEAPEVDGLGTAGQGSGDATTDDMPVFHRMWSTPTPPDN